jgi:purine-binding chemotaxis protein CheW
MANDEHLPDELDAPGSNDSPLDTEGAGDSFELPNWGGFGESADVPDVAALALTGESDEPDSGEPAPAWGDVQPEWLASTADVASDVLEGPAGEAAPTLADSDARLAEQQPVSPWAAPPEWGWRPDESPRDRDGSTPTQSVAPGAEASGAVGTHADEPIVDDVAPFRVETLRPVDDVAAVEAVAVVHEEPLEALADDESVEGEATAGVEVENLEGVVETVEAAATAERDETASPSAEHVDAHSHALARDADDAREALTEILDEIEREVVVDDSADSSTATPRASQLADQYVVFVLGGTNYAVPIGNVLEMNLVPKTTPVPNVPDWVRGVTNLRGNILPIIELRSFFGFSPLEQTGAGRMVVVRSLEDDMTTGLVVDSVRGRRDLVSTTIGAPAAPIEDKVAPFMRGVHGADGEMLVVFDMERFLASPEVRQFESD